ncbi:sulfatase-like hydrolase/transferase [Sphingobium sp. BHU LFT2]|uniref:sulfatase-like hydrolase/transferase n=1 Tax=Sphingobium sp. BHU LFT2 TaxID=2807634 RepID=UPI001BEAEBA2|nr:sulfatase-like hydrolase/transferase [Sphingobium sp. BHU LFT2]MBT2246081.1 sulfatase-like hydrolase/transferase [Sphingobium sp. BHU LFT2]
MAITRRTLIGSSAALGLAAKVAAAEGGAAKRPNILWLVSEDNNPFIGSYGDKLAHTPTIDRLAKGGTLFCNAYSNAPVCAPSRFAILAGVYPESCAPANHMRAVAHFPKEFRTYPELLRSAGYFCTNNAKTDYNCDVQPAAIWDRQGKAAHWRQAPAGQPFMAVFNHETTHESRVFGSVPGAVRPADVRVPPYLPDTPGIRQDYATYYNLMEKMDGQIAARLAELEADGLADDTIIFYYSDNGGVLPRSKRYCYDEGHRCALVVHVPPKWRHLAPTAPGRSIDAPVSFIDLAPTVLAIAGVRQPAQMTGRPLLGQRKSPPARYAFGMRNRMDERYDFTRTVTDGRWRYIRHYMPHRPWGQHQAFEWLAKGYQEWEAAYLAGTLNETQARFFRPKPHEELFDLTTDPDQVTNRIDDAGASAKAAELRRALDHHLLAINDNGFIPEGMAGEGYVESRAVAVYPLRQIVAVAGAAAGRDPARAPLLVRELTNTNAVIRYWAATGLLIHGVPRADSRAALEAIMRSDPVPQVRIAAAEAVATLWSSGEAVELLGALAGDGQVWQVRLQALNALTYVGEPSRAVLPVIEAAAATDHEYLSRAGLYLAATLKGTYTPAMKMFDIEQMMRNPPKSVVGG